MIRAAVLFAAVTLASTASAQAPSNQISYGAVMKAPLGSWAEYVMSKKDEDETVRVRYTLVERSPKRAVIEIDSATPIGRMLMRLEFAGHRDRYKLEKARMKLGTGDPRDMPIPDGADGKGTTFGKDDMTGEHLAREELTLKAGKFTVDHYRRKVEGWTTEVWVDDKVAPVGLVQLTDGQGGRIELIGTGKGGKSAF